MAHKGAEALNIYFKDKNIDVSMIITDMNMPIMTGAEFINKLREFHEFDSILL